MITVDITGAYLKCTLPEGDEVIMELDALVTKLLQELDPDAKQYETVKGTTLVKHFMGALSLPGCGTSDSGLRWRQWALS